MELSHVNDHGQARMVDITAKNTTERCAIATGIIRMKANTLELVRKMEIEKGDVLATARIAGIMATKKTPELIPLCHPLMITGVTIELEYSSEDAIIVTARVNCTGQTGVEMEALTAVSVAALTVYDMCKAVDKGMTIENIRLESKDGGKSGAYRRENDG